MFNYKLIGIKNSSRANQLDCIISYFFQLHLMLYACVEKFDVTDTVGNFSGTKQVLSSSACMVFQRSDKNELKATHRV